MESARKGALLSAGVTSIACLGDTILYSVLPVYAETLGLSDFWLGFFLSINRFVRLFFHGIVAYLIIQFGLKQIVTVSTILSCLSTFIYQFPRHVPLFVFARIVWGIAYSGLRQTMLLYTSQVKTKRNHSFALAQFIKSVGPFLILIVGPVLFSILGYRSSYLIITAITVAAILLARSLPEISITAEHFGYLKIIRLSSYKLLLFLISFVTDGLMVVILFLLFHDQNSHQATLLLTVSFFLFLKRFISSFLPLVFLKSFRAISIRVHFFLGILLILIGLIFLQKEFFPIGLVLSFIGGTVVGTTAPIKGLDQRAEKSKIEVITSVTFWWDLGKAFGALLGVTLFKYLGNGVIWIVLGGAMTVLSLVYCRVKRA